MFVHLLIPRDRRLLDSRSGTTPLRPAGTVENSPGVHSWERGATQRVFSPVGTAEPTSGRLLQSSLRDSTGWVGRTLGPRNEFLGYYRSSPRGLTPIGKPNHVARVLFSNVLSVRNADLVSGNHTIPADLKTPCPNGKSGFSCLPDVLVLRALHSFCGSKGLRL